MLRARARLVVPGGMWGHMNAARSPPDCSRNTSACAEGCRLWDVDGNQVHRLHVQLTARWCSASGDPDVERCSGAQRARGDVFNGPSEKSWWSWPSWSWTRSHMPTGRCSPRTALTRCDHSLRDARARRNEQAQSAGCTWRLSWRGAVVHAFASPGVTTEDRAHLLHFDYNDMAEPRTGGPRGSGR